MPEKHTDEPDYIAPDNNPVIRAELQDQTVQHNVRIIESLVNNK